MAKKKDRTKNKPTPSRKVQERNKKLKRSQKRRLIDEIKATPGYDQMTEHQKMLLEDTIAFKQMVEGFDVLLEHYNHAFENAKEKYNCRQVQRTLQDISSIRSHIKDLEENGPTKADKEIPLEESEWGETEGGNVPPEQMFSGVQIPKEIIEDALLVEAEEAKQDAQD